MSPSHITQNTCKRQDVTVGTDITRDCVVLSQSLKISVEDVKLSYGFSVTQRLGSWIRQHMPKYAVDLFYSRYYYLCRSMK